MTDEVVNLQISTFFDYSTEGGFYMQEIIHQTMRNLGITRNYRGYKQLFIAVELALEDEDRLLNVQEEIFRPTAEILHCNILTIERNIRTVINRVWGTNSRLLQNYARYNLKFKPTVTEFIEIIVNHVFRTCRNQINKK